MTKVAKMSRLRLLGARHAIGAQEAVASCIDIHNGRIRKIGRSPSASPIHLGEEIAIELSGYLLLPGLINAHDHLTFSLFPRLGGRLYRNYVDWGEDIHLQAPEIISIHRAVPKDVRVWWGGIRNLLCGVTTVSQHDPLQPQMFHPDFPVRVVRKYGWAHSVALGGDLRAAKKATPRGAPFLVHACEGIDEVAYREVWELDRLDLLDKNTTLVHGLALDREGVGLLAERGCSLIVCPSSNQFLFGVLPDLSLFSELRCVALGNDSPLTALGDLLDEVRVVSGWCGQSSEDVFDMVTTVPANLLRLRNGEGSIVEGGVADLIGVRDTGTTPADRLSGISQVDVELVVVGGRIQLVSDAIWRSLPSCVRYGLEPLYVDGGRRWVRAPVADLLRRAEQRLGAGQVKLGSRSVATLTGANCGDIDGW